jgi:hypothetical protein
VTPLVRARTDNLNAPYRLLEPGAAPAGGIIISTTLHPTGGYLYATGDDLSPNRKVSFYAVGINTTYPLPLGSLTTDIDDNLFGWQPFANVACRSGQTGPATIVVLDEASDVVTTAGTTEAFRH